MTSPAAIIGMGDWLQTPPGRQLVLWEQHALDSAVADVFGYHALQLGLPELDALRCNRMPHRWLAHERPEIVPDVPLPEPVGDMTALLRRPIALQCLPEVLPFAEQSLDLVVMPHTLEQCSHPHQALAEVIRVLRPEGRVVICGFNPVSLWGVSQTLGCWCHRVWGQPPVFLPLHEELISARRVRDWLNLLSCDVVHEQYGCYRMPWRRGQGIEHSHTSADRTPLGRLGERWWHALGSVYLIVAVKRVRGMRLVGLTRAMRKTAAARRAVTSSKVYTGGGGQSAP